MSDSGGRYPTTDQLTADFAYLRLHAPRQLYGSRYPVSQIRGWAKKLVSSCRETFIYFNNDAQGHAVRNAWELKCEVARLQPAAGRVLSSR